jgi:hypothetical protein
MLQTVNGRKEVFKTLEEVLLSSSPVLALVVDGAKIVGDLAALCVDHSEFVLRGRGLSVW